MSFLLQLLQRAAVLFRDAEGAAERERNPATPMADTPVGRALVTRAFSRTAAAIPRARCAVRHRHGAGGRNIARSLSPSLPLSKA